MLPLEAARARVGVPEWRGNGSGVTIQPPEVLNQFLMMQMEALNCIYHQALLAAKFHSLKLIWKSSLWMVPEQVGVHALRG